MKKDEIIEQLAPYYKARQDQNGLKPSPLSKVKLKELNSKLKVMNALLSERRPNINIQKIMSGTHKDLEKYIENSHSDD